ncbi:MAG TPA: plastocyanin/azurin family copper-binding protein [Gemmatimonadales bacterium]|nr:plastocyanin/azurin family copper-binding protein [Gemmatimonadales bacterium]
MHGSTKAYHALRTPLAALVVGLVLAGCGGSDSTTPNNPNNSPPPAPANHDINIVTGASTKTTGAFSPNPKAISLSADPAVRFVNTDITGGDYTTGTATVHHIVSDAGSAQTFDTGDLAGNATSTITFNAPGTINFHCSIHPNMVGSVVINP